jgi:hypothetical protein
MTLEINNIYYAPPIEQKTSFSNKLLNSIPAEGVAFLVASVAVRIFSASFACPLLGIGISLVTTTLVLKSLECYDQLLLINLTKEACKLSKKYPKIQMIACICALVFSLISRTSGFLLGALIGSFSSLILDVERYKLIQKANRSRLN